MPTQDRRKAISLHEAISRTGRVAFANSGGSGVNRSVGLEQEYFVVRTDTNGAPAGRLPLGGESGLVASVDRIAAPDSVVKPRPDGFSASPEFALAHGGRLTFEPGGQIEHSTAVHDTAREALDDVLTVRRELSVGLASRRLELAGAGLDVWHAVDSVPLQLTAERYTVMDEYFNRRGPWGRLMMRHTGSLQLNLDHGADGVWQERWLLANLMAPVVLATFANSPGSAAVSTRALAWQGLDPTRTGFPKQLVNGGVSDPKQVWASAAMDADVMLFRAPDGGWRAGRQGFSFRSWIEHGHPDLGWPTAEDLDYHLTTLFFEVRPKGFLEIRTCESLPDRWRAAPVVMMTALLYDDRARRDGISLLEGTLGDLPERWRRGAVEGVRDDELGTDAARLWEIAFAGVSRMPAGFFGPEAVETAREFVQTFTARGRMPADVLSDLAGDPAASLAWAASCNDCPMYSARPDLAALRSGGVAEAGCVCQAS